MLEKRGGGGKDFLPRLTDPPRDRGAGRLVEARELVHRHSLDVVEPKERARGRIEVVEDTSEGVGEQAARVIGDVGELRIARDGEVFVDRLGSRFAPTEVVQCGSNGGDAEPPAERAPTGVVGDFRTARAGSDHELLAKLLLDLVDDVAANTNAQHVLRNPRHEVPFERGERGTIADADRTGEEEIACVERGQGCRIAEAGTHVGDEGRVVDGDFGPGCASGRDEAREVGRGNAEAGHGGEDVLESPIRHDAHYIPDGVECPSETRLQAFLDGEAREAEVEEITAHLDGCEICRLLVGAVQAVPLDDATEVERIGRYVLRRVLGRGGMGIVYEAVDPELQRVVALKVLRADLGDAQGRLLAEAQAMAKLSHPNVVAVHDVGREGDRVFVVMALVEGLSLRQWLAREPRTFGAVLDAFERAGEGLVAAHEAGLVHRDFKPENVFVAADGRLLVGDFGLALAHGADGRAEGSLAYMAPEQREGRVIDARADQYSFCAALAEAVGVEAVGARGGAEISSGPPRGAATPSVGAGVPRWLSRILARGTMAEPSARFDDLRTLLSAIHAGRRGASKRRRALVAVLAVALVVGLAVFGVRASRDGRQKDECRRRDLEVAAMWNDGVAAGVEARFRATGSPLADGAFRKVSAVLGAYRAGWQRAHESACEEAELRAPARVLVTEQRSMCLAERLEIFRAVTSRLAVVDGASLEHVPAMLELLPPIEACDDARASAERPPPPPPPRAAEVHAATRAIAESAATIAAGRYEEGLAQATTALRSAEATSYLPVRAEGELWVGVAHGRLGHARDAEAALERAASAASAARAPLVAIRAWIQLMHFVGYEGKRYDDGARYAEYAKSALAAVPAAFELDAERLAWSRAMLVDRKRFADALPISDQELALVDLRFGATHHVAAVALDGRAGVLAGLCRTRDALDAQARSCAAFEREYGDVHPQLALCLGNLASLHANLGEHDRALALKDRALAMFERLPGHPNHVGMARRNRVRSLLALGRLEEAAQALVAASAASQRESDEATILLLRGELARKEAKLDAALAAHSLALERTKGAEAPRRIDVLVQIAETNLAAAHPADAQRQAHEAAALAATVFGAESCRVSEPLRIEADAALAAGASAAALPLAERALRLANAGQGSPPLASRAAFAVARALPPEARERAKQLATDARATAGADTTTSAAIDRWLAGR